MKSSDDILKDVNTILKTEWKTRKGQKVPEAEDIQLGNHAVTLDGTVLYADMTDSTGLVSGYKKRFAAKVYKSYLGAACHIIRNNSGVITAFDGDRVMAVFVGKSKNTSAARAALQISYITSEINSKIKRVYPKTTYQLQHAIGIDSSALFVARTGIRDYNDLVWVGRSANYAAKLCSLASSTYSVFITKSVFDLLSKSMKYGGKPRQCMWDKTLWKEKGTPIYRSDWLCEF